MHNLLSVQICTRACVKKVMVRRGDEPGRSETAYGGDSVKTIRCARYDIA
jgi:hypothetical protein